MKSKLSHALILVAAIAAFLPVMAVDYLLDSYVRVKERAQLQQSADGMMRASRLLLDDTIGSLRRVLADSPSLCTPTFIANVHKQMEQSLYLKQVLVENGDGVQYCDAFGRQVNYSRLSPDLPVPGNTETIAVVKLGELDAPVLKVTQAVGNSRLVSGFVPLMGQGANALLAGLRPNAAVRVSLTNGSSILDAGDSLAFERSGSTEYVTAQAFAGEYPIRADAAVPFAIVRADYADLDASFTLIACLMSGAFFILALRHVRRSDLPAFDLERAIMAGELKPHYQPVINLRTGALAGCEVLCRWEKRNGEIVPPGAFIDYAEVTGLALPMTVSLMQQVKADLADLCRQMPDIKVSINLFEGHFRDGSIVDDVQAIFGGSTIAFRQLVFEITERRPLDTSIATHVISGLHALGCRLAMDDAGTGHSNLAYMQMLGVDVVKIDRIFVDMIKPDTTNVPVLDALIAMARDLGTDIVAEGVETEAQALYLRARGVVLAQGYLFAPALKAQQFRELAGALGSPGRLVLPTGVADGIQSAAA